MHIGISATGGTKSMKRRIPAMDALLVIAALVLLAVAAPRWGADTHRSGEWSSDGYQETWTRPDRERRAHLRPLAHSAKQSLMGKNRSAVPRCADAAPHAAG